MDKLKVMLSNWPMALVGLVIGAGQYAKEYGVKPPATRAEWASFAWGLCLVVIYPVFKSATTGSRPGTASTPQEMESVLSPRTPMGMTSFLPTSSVEVIPLDAAVAPAPAATPLDTQKGAKI